MASKGNRSLDNPVVQTAPRLIAYLNIFVEFFGGSFIEAVAFTQLCYWRRRTELAKVKKPLYANNKKLSKTTGITMNSTYRIMHDFRKKYGFLESGVKKKIIFTEKGEKLYQLYVHTISNVKSYKRRK